MDRKTLVAMVLCLLIFMGWQKFYIEPRMPQPQQQIAATGSGSTTPAQPASTGDTTAIKPVSPEIRTQRPPEKRTISTDMGEATVSDGTHTFTGWTLKSYRLGLSPKAAAIDLQSVVNQDSAVEMAFDDPALGYLSKVQGAFQDTGPGVSWLYDDSNIRLKREIVPVPGEPYLNMTITAEFKARRPNYFFLSLSALSPAEDPEGQDRALLYWSEKSLERVHLAKEVQLKDIVTPIRYIGATNRYFLMTLVSQGSSDPKGQIQPLGTGHARLSMVYPVTGNTLTVPVRVYFGPKELELLRRTDPALDNTVDLGWFQLFAYPLLKLLKFFYAFLNNYGLAIILLTLLIKIVTFPLNYKSMKSMKDMARLQPQLQKIREKYKDDKETLNREMLGLMRTHGYNPAAGCLPMLIQMPIFFALYRVLYSSIELFHAPFMFWIQDLSARDPFYVTPVLLAGTMFLQQKLTPQTTTDPAQQKMMQFMPLIFGFMMLNLPSGLTLYMLVNAVASIAQQLFLNKKLDGKSGSTAVATA
jgi:YidC/Oxa1 family membrane protein insertase